MHDRRVLVDEGNTYQVFITDLQIVGNDVFATRTPCAGPCDATGMVDRAGHWVTPRYPGGTVTSIDRARLAIIPDTLQQVMTVMSPRSGHKLQSIKTGAGAESRGAMIAAGVRGVITRTDTDFRFAWFAAGAGRRVKLTATQSLRTCAAP